ncbi:pseudaminic acid cytidylyltransferase [Planctobacterium marinum]|uniref:pseudaminic acid cytidylyltransferase n=1 Tax=Planctobacterium marinum TaxID=1631968 RepID=UPI001E4EEDDA|nr:pseudaminic acid cytidylyltransferase [Planctobacterium marinum]MCC2606262.1 pseudaminic acid cytidylyltransferase [Planctobacterium marinum]
MKLAVIPARGGSKRIPGKNIRLFSGKPLINYSIEAAINSQLFDKVIVSTDCEEIKALSLSLGAEVPFLRPEHLSNDIVGTRPVTNHAIEYCREHFFNPEYVCCIYATAPFIEQSYLKQGLEALEANERLDFAFSVTTFPFPVQRALVKDAAGVKPMMPEFINKRSQDLEEVYHDAGQFYWGKGESWLSGKVVFSANSYPVVLPRHLVQDIDTQEDWIRAELMYRAYVQDR